MKLFSPLLVSTVFLFVSLGNAFALDAKVQGTDGEVLEARDFSMDSRRHFSMDWKSGAASLDRKQLAAFEIMRERY